MRTDHLIAVLNYALEQAKTSSIPVLDFGDNENDLKEEEQVEELQSMLNEVKNLIVEGHTEVNVVERNSLAVLVQDTMFFNFNKEVALEDIKEDFMENRILLGIDEKLIEETYEIFKEIHPDNEK